MALNRKQVMWGLAGLALTAVLVGGAGVAMAATATTPTSGVAAAGQSWGRMGSMDDPGHLGDRGDKGDTGQPGAMGQIDGTGTLAGMMSGEHLPMDAAAAYLGLSRADLLAQLQNGTSLAEVAAAQGTSLSGLEDAMLTAMATTLDADTTLTAPQKAAALALMKSHLDQMVTATHSSGAGFGMSHGMMGK